MFLLIEGRGFWRQFRRDELMWRADGAVRPKGQCWSYTWFGPTGDRSTFMSGTPAIGPANGSTDEFYRPGGWHAPTDAPGSLIPLEA